jgi:transposase
MATMGHLKAVHNELWKGELDHELTQLDAVTAHMDSIVKRLEAIGKKAPRVQRLKTIPGVGPRTAEILVACIDERLTKQMPASIQKQLPSHLQNPHRQLNPQRKLKYERTPPKSHQ